MIPLVDLKAQYRSIKGEIDAAVFSVLDSGEYILGSEVCNFEREFATYCGSKEAVAVNSGTSALHLALLAAGIGPGDEVITVSMTFVATASAITYTGATPVFIDVDIPTYNIVPETVEEAITPKTRAIMAAHTLGNPFDAERIFEIAKRHKLFLIEDCCDALGATLNGRHVGTFGDIGTLSFYPAHHITMGEGGAVFTQNPVLRRAMETFRDWGRDCYCDPGKENTCKRRFDWQLGELPYGYDHKYIYSHLGFNLKVTDMQAAVGVAQLGHLDRFIEARRHNYKRLKDGLGSLEEFFIFSEPTAGSEPSWFGFLLTVRESAPFTRDEIVRHLNEKRIATRLLFGGNLVRQPYMQGRRYRVQGSLANSDRIMNQTFWIGVYPGLSNAHLDYTCETIRAYCRWR